MASGSGLFVGRFLPIRDPLLMETWHEAIAECLTRKGDFGFYKPKSVEVSS